MARLEELSFEPRGDVLLARVKGEVDLSNVWSVKEQLLHAIPNTAAALVLDLSDTGHLDSSGIRLIFELAERLRSHGQKLRLVVPDGSVISRVLMITEVHQVVPISASVEAVLGDEADERSS